MNDKNVKQVLFRGRYQGEGGLRKQVRGVIWPKCLIPVYVNRTIKLAEIVLRKGKGIRKSNRGGECDQNIFFAWIEILQRNPFV
jgi:hypothetical protein